MTDTTKPNPDHLLVATGSKPSALGGAIANQVRDKGVCWMQAIGAGAINQAVKAIAIARGYTAPAGLDLICTPFFHDTQINGEDRTAIRFKVEARK